VSKNIKGLVLITGTTSGVGLNTLKPLLRFGWEVIAVNRSNKRAIKIADESFTKEEVKNVHFIEIDLSNLDDVRKGCDEILERFKKPINSLICNAAVYKPRLKRPERSAQGFENSMAINHFGHFLMINLLMEDILSSEREIVLNGKSSVFKPRITVLGTVTANYSELGGRIPIPAPADLGDLSGFKNGFLSPISMANGKKFKPGKAYKDSKLCNMVTVQELSKRSTGRTMYILDEPTTGLHQHDIKKLLEILHTFVALGNTVVVIEHNLDVIKTADYIVDMGPEGGVKGGKIIAEGKPEEICKINESYTGKFLKPLLN